MKLEDGTAIRGRLYLPPPSGARMPAVIVAHGYLANLAFMEIPWARDLTRLGVAALFIDRRGHGQSGGRLWEGAEREAPLRAGTADLAAALEYLRSRQDLIDPERIAILGHSDGASAAIQIASADWSVAATAALSASAAPWYYVNHVVPQNLLLVYGARDHFILENTDRELIRRATRGYLADPGTTGTVSQGTARRLVRIPARGHVDVLYSDAARLEVLRWLGGSLDAPGAVGLGPDRIGWLIAGVAALWLAILTRGRIAVRRLMRDDRSTGGSGFWTDHAHGTLTLLTGSPRGRREMPVVMGSPLILLAAWPAGLLLSVAVMNHLLWIPAQQSNVFVALLLGTALASGAAGAATPARREYLPLVRTLAAPSGRRAAARGLFTGFAVVVALQLLLAHYYETALSPLRVGLLAALALLALISFAPLECLLTSVERRHGRLVGLSALLLLAVTTACASGFFLDRMSKLPGYLMASVLALVAAHRWSEELRPAVSSTFFGALLMGRVAAAVCALY